MRQKSAALKTKSNRSRPPRVRNLFCKNCRKIEMIMNSTYKRDGCKSFIILLVFAGVKLTGSLYPDLSDQPGLPIGIKFCDNCEYEPNCYFLVSLACCKLTVFPLIMSSCPLLASFPFQLRKPSCLQSYITPTAPQFISSSHLHTSSMLWDALLCNATANEALPPRGRRAV